jgi:hypothetical protein
MFSPVILGIWSWIRRNFSNFIRLFQVWQSEPRDAAGTGGRRQS